MKKAQGQYVIFLDGDDYVAPILVEELKKALSIAQADVFCWNFLVVDESGSALSWQFPWRLTDSYDLLDGIAILRKILIEKQLWVWTGSAAYSRHFLSQNDFLYAEKYYTGEDLEFEWRVLLKNPKVLAISKTLSYYVQRPASLTKTINFRQFDFYPALKQLYEKQKELISDDEPTSELLQAVLEWSIFNFLGLVFFQLRNSKKSPIKEFLKGLEQHHPGLFQMVVRDARSITRLVSKVTKKDRVYFSLFRFSPRVFLTIWLHLSRLKAACRRLIKKLMRDKTPEY